MSAQKAWWKKLTLKSVTGAVGTLFGALSGLQSGAQSPPQVTVQVPEQRQDYTPLLMVGAVALVLVLVMMRRR